VLRGHWACSGVLDTLELTYQIVLQAGQNRVTVVKSTDDKTVDELFEDCLTDTIAHMSYDTRRRSW